MKNNRNISHRTYRKLMYVLIVFGITLAGLPLLISNLLFIQKILLIIGTLLAVLGVTIGIVFFTLSLLWKSSKYSRVIT